MIKMLTSIAGEGFSAAPGEIIELDAATEKRLIASGQAEAVEQPKAKPKATAK